MFSKEKLVFDPSSANDTDNTGAFIRSADGTLITHTTDGAKERLDVATGLDKLEGSAFSAGDNGVMALAVDPNGDYKPLSVNADGELKVDVQVTTGSDKAEDSAHTSGDIGAYILSVREDSLSSSTSASGDYQSLKTDSLGRLWVNADETAPPTFTGWLVSPSSIGNTAALVVATDLTDRRRILIQNVSNNSRPVFIGHSNAVSALNGIRLTSGSAIELDLAAGVEIWAVCNAGTADVRVAELAK